MECTIQGGSLNDWEQSGAAVLTREETGELIVPDAMADVEAVVETDGQVFLRGKEARRGSVVLSGVLALTALVKTEGSGELKSLSTELPFEAEQSCPGVTETDRLIASLHLISAEAKLLNSRKLILRGEVCLSFSAWSSRRLEYCTELGAENCLLEQKRTELCILPVTEITERTFSVSDIQPLPAGKPQAEEVLNCRAALHPEEGNIVGGKLIIRGNAIVSVTYLTPMGNPAAAELRLPWSVILELDSTEGERFSRSVLALTGCSASVGENGGIFVDMGAVAQAVIRSRTALCCVTDAYGVDCRLETRRQSAELTVSAAEQERTETLSLRLENGRQPGGLLNLLADCGRPRQEQTETVIPVTVKALCMQEDGPMLLTGRGQVRCPGTGTPEVSTGEIYASVSGSGVEVRLPVVLREERTERQNVALLTGTDAEPVQMTGAGDVCLLRTRAGDSIWSLGKARGLGCAAIREDNGLEPEQEPEPGMLLLLAR